MSKIYYIEVSQETVNYIQGVDLEANSRKALLTTIATDLGVKSAAFKDYQKEYLEFDAEYQLIKQGIQDIYVPKALTDNHSLTWTLNFQTNLIKIEVTCDCGVEAIDNGEIVLGTPNTVDNIIETFNVSKRKLKKIVRATALDVLAVNNF